MKTTKLVLLAAACAGSMAAAAPAAALTFTLVDYNGSVAGTPAELGFKIATAYWSSVLTSAANVRLEIGYNPLPTNVIGSTGSTQYAVSTAAVYGQLAATGNSALDAVAVANLTPLTAAGGLQAYTNDYTNPTTKVGTVDYTKTIFDADDSANNTTLRVNGAVLKALGFTGINPLQRDGQVTFSSNFAFDFNPTDGIDSDKIDFIAVAIHEIGHALGFVSGVDRYDTATATSTLNASSDFSTLDLFRYSAASNGKLDEVVGDAAYFSIDGGKSQLFGNSLFSTGANHGDGRQASHWKDGTGCPENIGILDPSICYGTGGSVTASDLAAYDAMGWNTSVNVLANPSYVQTTADIYRLFAASVVPEPASWAMMVAGFAVLGGALRSPRARGKVRAAA